MKNLVLILLLNCAFLFSAQATHIVGGELGFKPISGNQYQFSLTLYFDAINGSSGALRSSVVLRIFRKSDNAHMEDVTLPRTQNNSVNY